MQLKRKRTPCPIVSHPCQCIPSTLPQAILQVALQVHADTILGSDELGAAAERLQARLATTWLRLDGLLQSCRCMVGLLGNMQA